ncbi:uncharacterized protein DUF1801 [Mucilaginibacter yixingensis]|uniref:Uncharacterized protein DUF1801 n=1 Tax=Mucilaginibacter yixingensis TaxID=1295612 RepID=A0A2T5JA89_9SPHI|nr:DUF1801 domain-containing protein [Mucilaginibacter yixingensis]PTQ96954.1 uncharacterized protein DUF1801 [Mucilaginibacter yixingensis]
MAKLKTTETVASVADFINTVDDEAKRADSHLLVALMQQVTRLEPKMWGPSIIGFDSYHYKYDSGHEGDMMMVGFSPRKATLTLYIHGGADYEGKDELLAKLGKHTTSKGCLYIKKLKDVDMEVLKQLVEKAYAYMRGKYPG